MSANVTKPTPSWRDVLSIHPAAELFPRMSRDELKALGEDIIKNGLSAPIALWRAHPKVGQAQLLDGRSRLDAIELVTGMTVEVGAPSVMAGEDFCALDRVIVLDKKTDPFTYVISANIHRRHLTAEQRRELIAAVIKTDPSKSDRQIGEMIKADHKTVGAVRAQQEATGEISPVEKRVGKDRKARKQPARKTQRTKRPPAKRNDVGPDSTGEMARKDARIEQLENEKRLLELQIEELESKLLLAPSADDIKKLQGEKSQRDETIAALRRRITDLEQTAATGAPPPPADDDLDIPPSLRRSPS